MNKYKILHRDRVNNELKNILDYPLTIVTAPMGYGKSTAVKEFLFNNKTPNLLIAMNEAYKNVGYFWSVLTNRLGTVDKGIGNIFNRLGYPQDKMQIDRLIEMSFSIPLRNEFVLVLDDYQYGESDSLNSLIELVAKQDIPKLHLVIISRSFLKLDMTELLVKNLVYQIDEKSLRFNDSDVHKYFCNLSMPIQKEKIQQIQEIADGWVAALYLIYRGLKEGIPMENIKEIQGLIRNGIYNTYNDETKGALRALSSLDSFSMDLAAYATGIESIEEIISNLHKDNSFVHYDKRTNSYTIHNLFRNFLLCESNNMEGITKEINRRAGQWYLKQGDFHQAFFYLYKGEDYESILSELEKPSLYIKSSDRNMIFNIFEKIPKRDKERHPIAYLKYMMLLIISGDKKLGISLLREFERDLDLYQYEDEIKKQIQAAIHLLKMFYSFNDLELMISHIEEALDYLDGGVSVIASPQGPFSFGSPHLSYLYYKKAGTYERIARMPYEKYAKLSGGAGVGAEALCAAEYALETGDFDSVEANALKTIYQARTKNQTSVLVCAIFTLARLYIYQNQYPKALNLLGELSDEVSSNIESILMNTYDLSMAYIYGCANQYEKIPRWIREGDMSINSPMVQGAVFSYVVYGKALILSRDWVRAEALLETFNSYFSIFNNQLGFLHNYIHLAIAAFNRGNEEIGRAWLEKALLIGQADNIIMPFIENGDKLISLLKSFKEDHGIDMAYISKIIEGSKNYFMLPSLNFNSINHLSSREIEVLDLLSKGMSRNEIAADLFISPGTVRTHMQNIYRKLGVKNKIDAINKAKGLSIL